VTLDIVPVSEFEPILVTVVPEPGYEEELPGSIMIAAGATAWAGTFAPRIPVIETMSTIESERKLFLALANLGTV
jgi:hypothetical protein